MEREIERERGLQASKKRGERVKLKCRDEMAELNAMPDFCWLERRGHAETMEQWLVIEHLSTLFLTMLTYTLSNQPTRWTLATLPALMILTQRLR